MSAWSWTDCRSLGVTYRDATHGEHFRKILRTTGFDRSRPSILLEPRARPDRSFRRRRHLVAAFRAHASRPILAVDAGRRAHVRQICLRAAAHQARCRFTPRAAQAPGARRCASATIPKLWPSASNSRSKRKYLHRFPSDLATRPTAHPTTVIPTVVSRRFFFSFAPAKLSAREVEESLFD